VNGFCTKTEGMIKEYTECQAFSPVIRIFLALPHPLTRKLVLPPPPPHPYGTKGPRGGDTLAEGEGAGGANADEGTDTLVL
jgi:hypothetical protein